MVTSPQLPDWLARLYPFAPRSWTTPRGARMSYLDEGPRTDEAVLLLHGNPTWSFYYRELVRELAPRVRCVAPDHVGMGLSEKPADYPYDLGTRIADIEALVAALGLRRVHLVVHDWGGAIGFGWAVRHPQQVGGIAILNTAAFVSARIPARISLCRTPVLGEAIVRGLNGFAGPAACMAMHARRLTPAEKQAYLLPYDSWAHRVAVHRFVRDIPLEPDHPSRAALAAIERGLPELAGHPLHVLWGGRDFCFNDHFLARWRSVYPQAAVDYQPQAGHYVLEDAGAGPRSRLQSFLLNAHTR